MRKLKAQLEKQLGKHKSGIVKIQRRTIINAFFVGVEFDYCLVNLYRDGNDHINFHADNEAKDIVASMTLGATRRYIFSRFLLLRSVP
jgi:alkylated DNA repair dioxygenase AlkB